MAMKFSLTFVLPLLVFSGSLTPTSAQQTPICLRTSEVFSLSRVYEKSLCFVQGIKTKAQADALCTSVNMKLYDPYSSSTATSALANFAMTFFSFNASNFALVAGSTPDKCVTINGAGKIITSTCGISYSFICEYKRKNADIFPPPGVCGVNMKTRIAGGVQAQINEFPWMAFLSITRTTSDIGIGRFMCGGTLINSRFVLTAAHCAKGNNSNERIIVALGEYDRRTDNDTYLGISNGYVTTIEVMDKRRHPNYPQVTGFDIAVLELAAAVTFTPFIQPICLPVDTYLRDRSFINETLTVSGWGVTPGINGTNGSTSAVLLKVSIRGISNDDCMRALNFRVAESQMCAGTDVNANACPGDSGGPLMQINDRSVIPTYWYIAGVVGQGSGKGCGNGDPVVYAKVSYHLDWIRDSIIAMSAS